MFTVENKIKGLIIKEKILGSNFLNKNIRKIYI